MTIANQALPLWGLDGANLTLIATRENDVYRVDHTNGVFALRIHRHGYRTDDQLTSELDWMAWLSQSGLSVPTPKCSLDGSHLQIVDGLQIDVLSWMSGATLHTLSPKMGAIERKQVFYRLGHDMAKLHTASDAWPKANTCTRPAWDTDGLLGETPLWDRFWDNPGLNGEQSSLLSAFREKARIDLNLLSPSLDYGLIHADLVPDNVIIDGDTLHFIDFDDGGFGFRLFEIATALLKHRLLSDFEELKTSMIDGYVSQRSLNIKCLDLFLALRAMTYVGWNITRMAEDATGERNARFVAQALELATAYQGLEVD